MLWGQNIMDTKKEEIFDEPILVCKIDEHQLNIASSDY